MKDIHGTTVIGMVRNGRAAIAADGQLTAGNIIVKSGARKIRVLGGGKVLAGFAGGGSDALNLFERFENALDSHRGNLTRAAIEVARQWRSDRMLRRLEAQLIVFDTQHAMSLSGTGDLFEPDDGILATGSGGGYALAAARALVQHTDMPVEKIAEASIRIASEICIYTGGTISVETLPRDA
jgi:ATP-dependent HslUV protease, peptidase subunit HslV